MPFGSYLTLTVAFVAPLILFLCEAHAAPVANEVASLTFWKDVIPLLSVPLAVAAFFHSRQSDIAKAERERREELKESIEKLIDFRGQFEDKQATLTNEQQFEAFSSRLNTRKLIYLQSAEELARNLDHVTPAEWIVLGYEHLSDSNFLHAEEMYQRAVRAADTSTSSLVTKVSAQRSLASAQMLQGEDGLARGRMTYARSINMLANANDPFSRATIAMTYRDWADVEGSLGHLVEAAARLSDAVEVLAQMPDGVLQRRIEARQCARSLCDLANQFRRVKNNVSAHLALDRANAALADWADGPTYEVRGCLSLCEASISRDGLDSAGAQSKADAARKWFEMLDVSNPARQWGLNEVSSLLSDLAKKAAAEARFQNSTSLTMSTKITVPPS